MDDRYKIYCFYCTKKVEDNEYYELPSGDISHITCLPKGNEWMTVLKRREDVKCLKCNRKIKSKLSNFVNGKWEQIKRFRCKCGYYWEEEMTDHED